MLNRLSRGLAHAFGIAGILTGLYTLAVSYIPGLTQYNSTMTSKMIALYFIIGGMISLAIAGICGGMIFGRGAKRYESLKYIIWLNGIAFLLWAFYGLSNNYHWLG